MVNQVKLKQGGRRYAQSGKLWTHDDGRLRDATPEASPERECRAFQPNYNTYMKAKATCL
jgi:hypothetical protein